MFFIVLFYRDFLRNKKRLIKFCKCFSVSNNLSKLILAEQGSKNLIQSLDMLKVLTMLFIVLCHTLLVAQIFIKDLPDYREKFRRVIFGAITYNGTYCVGTFFVISGILQCYAILRRIKRNERSMYILNYVYTIFKT